MKGNSKLKIKIFCTKSNAEEPELGTERIEDMVNEWLGQAENYVEEIFDVSYSIANVGNMNSGTIVHNAIVKYKSND